MTATTRARTIIKRYSDDCYGTTGETPETALADLVADLMLWAALNRLSWSEAIDNARFHASTGNPCTLCGDDIQFLDSEGHCPDCAI
ncbi:hypothetical protein [Streptomyces luteireticuli]|uniref:hypothetical protein n=1 Tax=Streptomyces luteireticuli TaxID=173858 RepID=UPI00355623CB